jgi:hypothetical protein
MQRTPTFLRPATAVLISLLASTAIAACGGSSGSGSSAASARSDGLKYATCVRAHGVPDYPDPGAGKSVGSLQTKDGKVIVGGQTLSESWAVVRPALDKCQTDINPSFGPRYSTAQLAKVQAGALAMSKCMRAHGLNYPDLKVGPGPGGHGFEVGAPHFDHATLTSPQFKKDNIICSRLLNRAVPGKKG